MGLSTTNILTMVICFIALAIWYIGKCIKGDKRD